MESFGLADRQKAVARNCCFASSRLHRRDAWSARSQACEPEEKMKASLKGVLASAGVALLCLGATACGSSVSGHTYAGNGELVKIEFQSGGKAFASMGPMTSSCTYTQSGKTISLICKGDTTELTVASDGSLNGPPDGMLSHLSKVK
jgi:hypothetical protein